MFDLLGEQLI